ncbi:MAG: glycosyltransferase family 4 protein [Clostridium sp.]
MNILFLTLVYPEEKNARGIYIDLINELKAKGNNVTVVTPRERRFNKDTSISDENGVKVLRVKTLNLQKCNIIEKGFSTLLLENQFIKGIKQYLRNEKFDLVIYSTPPITFAKVIEYVKSSYSAKSYLLLKDIFPQNAVDMEMMSKGSLLYKYFRKKEKDLYNLSDFIGCMSQGNVDYLLKHNKYIDNKKVEICPNSILPLEYVEIDDCKRQEVRNKYKIPLDQKVVIYGGNLGKPQGIDFLVDILKTNINSNKVYFMIVGSGTEFNKIDNWIKENNPKNVQLYSMLPKDDYDALVKACDIGLILLDHRFTIPNFPSRILSYMEVGMPIVAAVDKNTDVGTTIENGGFGYTALSTDIEGFNSNLNRLVSDDKLLLEMGKKSRSFLEENYLAVDSAETILKRF